ncbi:hypothetical protein [Fulvivirga sedimenti]|uniref:Uncharacterized protein n=1 Tax=Fulvivirga sedimenti TaxID=2879465 RepID=A0A9X1L331_9BACT|nr:hypothetical protein [Fulvivirga sedimenti]MCA6078811.1 hypothetical protein [Fulvivirga sedimenti]
MKPFYIFLLFFLIACGSDKEPLPEPEQEDTYGFWKVVRVEYDTGNFPIVGFIFRFPSDGYSVNNYGLRSYTYHRLNWFSETEFRYVGCEINPSACSPDNLIQYFTVEFIDVNTIKLTYAFCRDTGTSGCSESGGAIVVIERITAEEWETL